MNRTTLLRLVGLVAIFGGMPLYWWAFPPRLPIGTADGTYTNPCCGPVRLHNGQMALGRGLIVSYVVEHDKIGRYVLPSSYVGVWSGKAVQADGSAYPLKLRLNDATRPTSIELVSGSEAFDFKQVEGNGS
ncbi:MAG: hypothetical protein JWO15_116 [Sphingomonadales bacterium]|nr:hypothetical protein [Sphingomonadales bacterium]